MNIFKDITVITPCFNGEQYIRNFYERLRCISKDLFIVIVDDCSSDGTARKLVELKQNDHNIKVISLEKNLGPAGARIIGMKYAKTNLISFIDIDDFPCKNKFKVQASIMKDDHIMWSFHCRRLPSGEIIGEAITKKSHLYTRRCIGLSSVMIKRDVIPLISKDYGIRRGEDYVWWFRINEKYGLPYFVDEIYYDYNVSEGTLSAQKLQQAISVFKIYTRPSLSKVSIVAGITYFMCYAVNAVFLKRTHKKLVL